MPIMLNRRTILQAAALLPGLSLMPGVLRAETVLGFTHSVASGDPTQDSVALWTRFVAPGGGESTLRVEIAEDSAFKQIVSRGSTIAGPQTDYCAHACPTGLAPGRWFYYRFLSPTGEASPVGRTRTLPAGSLRHCRIGVFSCSNATSGWFNAYAHAAERDDLDLIVHLGDYIYESPVDRSDAIARLAIERDIQPHGEAATLADYRLRYASYRNDRGLQELHRRFPIVAMWDDHETANNSWKDGAKNHDASEGPWDVRKAAGVRAFREWLPMRDSDYSAYQLGDLATMFRLETRLLARSKQLEVGAALLTGGDPGTALIAFRDGPLADPARTMMGAKQEQWLADGLAESVRSGTRWQILAQQVVMVPGRLPAINADWFAPGTIPNAKKQAELKFARMLDANGISLGMDRWDGYPAARARLLESATRARANLVVLSGDSHNAWASELSHAGHATGVEFAGHSVSSLGIEKEYGGDPVKIAASFISTNPAMKWCDTSRRGYMVMDLLPDSASCEWLFLPSGEIKSTDVLGSHRLVTGHGSSRLSQA